MHVEDARFRETTIPRVILEGARTWPDREALFEVGGWRLTFAELAERVREVVGGFVRFGMAPGDHFAVWAPNSVNWLVAALGGVSAGGVLIPLSTRFKRLELAETLRRSQPRLVFTVESFLGIRFIDLLGEVNGLGLGTWIIVMLDDAEVGGTITLSEFVAGSGPDGLSQERMLGVRPEDLSDILFTSGTTGRPKGVLATHGQTMRGIAAWSHAIGIRPGDRLLHTNPLFHIFGYKACTLGILAGGATSVVASVFDVDQYIEVLVDEQITTIAAPPATYQLVLDRMGSSPRQLPLLRNGFVGASRVDPRLARDIRSVLGLESLALSYGMTEATSITSITTDDDPELALEWSGRPIPGVEVKFVDERGDEVPVGEPGEIWVRGYVVTPGYLDDGDVTTDATDSEGWFHTGDVGSRNAQGYVKITDRLKDMFITGGFNVYPAEVESLMSMHADVTEVAVVGVPDPRLGEVGYAFVVTSRHTDTASLRSWCTSSMSNYKVPHYFTFVDALPRTENGKVSKVALRLEALAAVE